MIGVICDACQEPAVREFFELFKTPWAMFDPSASYAAVIVAGDARVPDAVDARLVISFAGLGHAKVGVGPYVGDHEGHAVLSSGGAELPIFRGAEALSTGGEIIGRRLGDLAPLVREREQDGRRFITCGYDLFAEVEFLLGRGQPVEHSRTPTLDRHTELLRRWMVEADLELVELHPTPPQCGLLATLTHDIDFMGIRRHKFDRTLLGFLYRAIVGSVLDIVRGRGSARRLLRNWSAVLSLPFVQVGLLADFWLPFERYDKADRPWRSTFFIVPFRGRPGKAPAGGIAAGRGVPYGANEIAPQLRELAARGHEIALHGIDAWWDGQASREELGALRTACDADVTGVRMHWLFFDDASPGTLDLAGFDYDATVGYNDAVGFRAGTAQVFAPLDTEHLLELPLMIQDTSLLYPSRMHCREDEAVGASQAIVDTVHETGGVATISWHERSLSPERLWDRVYHGVLAHLRARDASVRPAREVVAWFRTRRSVSLEGTQLSAESVARLAIPDPEVSADALRVRIHHPLRDAAGAAPRYTDLAVRPADLIALVRDAHALAI